MTSKLCSSNPESPATDDSPIDDAVWDNIFKNFIERCPVDGKEIETFPATLNHSTCCSNSATQSSQSSQSSQSTNPIIVKFKHQELKFCSKECARRLLNNPYAFIDRTTHDHGLV